MLRVLRPSRRIVGAEKQSFDLKRRWVGGSMVDAGGIASIRPPSEPVTPVDTGLGCLGLVLALSGEAFGLDRACRGHVPLGGIADCDDLVRTGRVPGPEADVGRPSSKRINMTGTRGRRLLAACLASLLAAQATPTPAADISKVTAADQRTILALSGKIDAGDGQKFTRLLAAAPADHTVTVNLGSTGGLIGEALKIATIVRSKGISTRVEGNAICASACFLIFAAGKQ